jgi:serine/threonine-protein kinase
VSFAIEPGVVIDGKYRVVRRIGEGGMGTVYEGENVRIERRVAIKVLHEHVASSAEFSERFDREARASARVGSEHVCDVLDLGDLPNGQRFLVMEFLEGESLEDRLERVGRMTVAELAPIAFQLLEGLGKMHMAGVIHRDLKPANIFLSRSGRKPTETVKILDFGVAKIVPRADQPSQMTSTGIMMGTPLYMSPEQARGARDVDGRTDLYAASVIFYRALTGDLPHLGNNLHELLFKIVLEDARPIRDSVPEVDEAFAAIVTKGLARDAEQRFSSAREYQLELAAWAEALGDPSLRFNVTLSDVPPVLNSLSGYPASRIAELTPSSLAAAIRVGPPTPQLTNVDTVAAVPTPTGRPRPAGRTPMGWADATPENAAGAFGAGPVTKRESGRLSTAGGTQVIESRQNPARPVAQPTSVPPPRGSHRGAIVATAAAFLVVAGVVGFRFASSTTKPASGASAVVTSAAAPSLPIPAAAESAPTAPADVASAAPAPEPTMTTSATTRALTAPASPPPSPPRVTTGKAAAPASTVPAKSAVASAAASVAPPPATTSSSGHRKFRTEL